MNTEIASNEYRQVLEQVTRAINQAKALAVQGANAQMVRMYWNVGKLVSGYASYGSRFIDDLSADIRLAFPGIKGFSPRSIRYMAKFANEVDDEFCSMCCKIPWGHIMYLLDKTEPGPERAWYANAAIENGWTRNVLALQIDTNLYGRQELAEKVTNFRQTLPLPESGMVEQQMKDPYIFDFITAHQDMNERDIEEQMVRNVTRLLLELGTGFAFMGRQYHLEAAGEDFYLDLLFYNTRLSRYVVVELKSGPFKPEYAGKLNFYLSVVDDLLRGEHDEASMTKRA